MNGRTSSLYTVCNSSVTDLQPVQKRVQKTTIMSDAVPEKMGDRPYPA